MTVAALNSHLANNKPPVIDSAYGLAEVYRVNIKTCTQLLKANGYARKKTPLGPRWIRGKTQLDRIEAKLNRIITHLGLSDAQEATLPSAASLSEALKAQQAEREALTPMTSANWQDGISNG